jgi:hypothetical protein
MIYNSIAEKQGFQAVIRLFSKILTLGQEYNILVKNIYKKRYFSMPDFTVYVSPMSNISAFIESNYCPIAHIR